MSKETCASPRASCPTRTRAALASRAARLLLGRASREPQEPRQEQENAAMAPLHHGRHCIFSSSPLMELILFAQKGRRRALFFFALQSSNAHNCSSSGRKFCASSLSWHPLPIPCKRGDESIALLLFPGIRRESPVQEGNLEVGL